MARHQLNDKRSVPTHFGANRRDDPSFRCLHSAPRAPHVNWFRPRSLYGLPTRTNWPLCRRLPKYDGQDDRTQIEDERGGAEDVLGNVDVKCQKLSGQVLVKTTPMNVELVNKTT